MKVSQVVLHGDRSPPEKRGPPPKEYKGIWKFIGLGTAHAMQTGIVFIGAHELVEGMHWWGYESLLFAALISAPFLVSRMFKVAFPWPMTFFIAFSLFLHCIGNFGGYYWSLYPFYDKFVHLMSGMMVAALALVAISLLARSDNEFYHVGRKRIPLVIIIFALILGAIWEVVEFVFDITLGTVLFTLQHGFWDTSIDMVLDGVGGAVVAAYSVLYMKRNDIKDLVPVLRDDDADNL
jgi:hypothetical protein